MNHHTTPPPTFWESTQGVHDEARILAASLRQEAINNFWRDAGALATSVAHSGSRAAARLGHRLSRHFSHRQQLEG